LTGRRDTVIIIHIEECCDQFPNGMTSYGNYYETFENDDLFRDAISFKLLKISRLEQVLSDHFTIERGNMPWLGVESLRLIVSYNKFRLISNPCGR
jgi:uncharacterized protein with HEPN domain